MRFPQVVLATAVAALACEKGPSLSSGTQSLTPAAVTTTAEVTTVATASAAEGAPSAPRPPVDAPPARALPARALPGDPAANKSFDIEGPAGVAHAGMPSDSNLDNSGLGKSSLTEGNGEPMDDVDDEEVSASDKSGVDDAPSGPIDESEGADIDLRE